ncbi:MAG: WbqC family protein [Chloroflexi bacterium]|nr:WbqC family protein [Chloroflexota bacterium]
MTDPASTAPPRPRRVAVMQPYLFPYLGYWQLMASADLFVLYDDVQYVRGSWMNRNRVLVDGRPAWITLPVSPAPLRTSIAATRLGARHDTAVATIRRRVEQAYRSAPVLPTGLRILDHSFQAGDAMLLEPVLRSIDAVRDELGLTTPMVRSSTLDYDRSLPREARLIELCRIVGGEEYLSLSGGRRLYRTEAFAAAGLRLRFHDLDRLLVTAAPDVDAQLSVLHAIMTVPRDRLRHHLHDARWLA